MSEQTTMSEQKKNAEIDPWDLLDQMLESGGDGDIDLEAALAEANGEAAPAEVDSAKRFLELLVRGEGIEFEQGVKPVDLAPAFAPILAEGSVDGVTDWLLDHEGVADLFVTDEQLEKILRQW